MFDAIICSSRDCSIDTTPVWLRDYRAKREFLYEKRAVTLVIHLAADQFSASPQQPCVLIMAGMEQMLETLEELVHNETK